MDVPATGMEHGDRRVVTALFADLVGYSRLVAELDPEDVRACVDDALGKLAAQVDRFGGSLEKFIGDAAFAVFGVPAIHDDDALRACLCALAMRNAIRATPGPKGREPLQLRIGLASGEVVAGPRNVAGQRSLAVVGEAVTTAARLQQLAEPDEILLDGQTLAGVGARIAAEATRERTLRGANRPILIFRLLKERAPAADRPAAGPMVGRDAERARLRELLWQTASTGRGHVCIVVGEAGMGKSRLLADLESDARAAGFAWTWTQNVSYGSGEPYRLVRKVVDGLSEEERIDAGTIVRRLLFTPDLDPERAAEYAGAVAALARDASVEGWEAEAALAPHDPREMARRLRDTVARFALRLGEEGPRVLVMDDLHWADPSSLPLVEAYARSCSEVPLLLLIGTRPSGVPHWMQLEHVSEIDLRGLDRDATARLAGAVAGHAPSEATKRLLHERTAGNPLFITEIVRALLEAGVLAVRGGRMVVTDPARVGLLPLGLRAVLGARIDALAPGARALLGVASVIGVGFNEDLLAELLKTPPVRADLERLASAGLIVPGETASAWRFAHPLFHDAAYAGLLASQRRDLHSRLADRLERDGQPAGRLAGHRAAAGDARRAIPLLVEAAHEAMALGAPVEAAGFWQRAGELAEAEPERAEFLERAESALRDVVAFAG